jgi:hypothetical protein
MFNLNNRVNNWYDNAIDALESVSNKNYNSITDAVTDVDFYVCAASIPLTYTALKYRIWLASFKSSYSSFARWCSGRDDDLYVG